MQGTQDKLKPSLTPPMILSIHVKVSPQNTWHRVDSRIMMIRPFFSQVKHGTCDSFESDKSHFTTSHRISVLRRPLLFYRFSRSSESKVESVAASDRWIDLPIASRPPHERAAHGGNHRQPHQSGSGGLLEALRLIHSITDSLQLFGSYHPIYRHKPVSYHF